MALSLDLMHRVDRYLGRIVVTLLQPLNLRRYLTSSPDVRDLSPGKILVVKFWGIGSIALAGPTVASLRRRYPEAEIHFLTLDANRPFLRFVPDVDQVTALDIRGGAFTVMARIFRLLWRLRRRRFDLVVDIEFFTRFSAIVSFVTGAPVRVGFHAWEVFRGNLHNIEVPFNRYWHVTRNFFNLGRAAGVDSDRPADFRLVTGEEEEREVEDVLAATGIEDSDRLVLFNPNAGDLALERRWPPESFAALARQLAEDPGVRPVFIGAPAERDYVERIVEDAGSRAVSLAGRLTIGGLLRLYDRAEALITNDSGPLQLALTQGLPTLSFFGPETPLLYGPQDEKHRTLYRHLACSPCINVHSQKRVRCIYGHSVCLESIAVDRAAAEARALLRGEPGTVWSLPSPRDETS
jgi:lipopolysaccharide heptosyltransferase II